jgi:hypothetical protein
MHGSDIGAAEQPTIAHKATSKHDPRTTEKLSRHHQGAHVNISVT